MGFKKIIFAFVIVIFCNACAKEKEIKNYEIEYKLIDHGTYYSGGYTFIYNNERGGTNNDFINLYNNEVFSKKVNLKSEQVYFLSVKHDNSNSKFTIQVLANGSLLKESVMNNTLHGDFAISISGILE